MFIPCHEQWDNFICIVGIHESRFIFGTELFMVSLVSDVLIKIGKPCLVFGLIVKPSCVPTWLF